MAKGEYVGTGLTEEDIDEKAEFGVEIAKQAGVRLQEVAERIDQASAEDRVASMGGSVMQALNHEELQDAYNELASARRESDGANAVAGMDYYRNQGAYEDMAIRGRVEAGDTFQYGDKEYSPQNPEGTDKTE